MREFFNYQSPYRTGIFLDLNIFEKLIPIVLIIGLAILLYKYKDVFKENPKLDKRMRIIIGIVFTIVYSSHYVFRFALYGFDTIVLPFHLCSIAMFLAILLLFTKNRTIYTFVLMAGIAGGVISLATPIIGYDSSYYRYYQFYIAHGLLLLTPLYFMFVHGYKPTGKEVRDSFIILQSIGIFMMVFNYYMGTDFMFLFLDPSKIDKFPAIRYFGGIPYYLVLVELVAIGYFYRTYKYITYKENKNLEVSYEHN